MSEERGPAGRRICRFPGCERPARTGVGRGRPPLYCDLAGHDPVSAIRERQRRNRAASAASTTADGPAIPAPRAPGPGPHNPPARETGPAALRAEQVARQLILASGQAQALAHELAAARTQIAELTTRAERAEAELATQREHYEQRLWVLGELPRPGSSPT